MAREALKTPPKGDSLKIKKDQQIVDAKPSKAWLDKQKLRIVDTYVDPKSKTKTKYRVFSRGLWLV